MYNAKVVLADQAELLETRDSRQEQLLSKSTCFRLKQAATQSIIPEFDIVLYCFVSPDDELAIGVRLRQWQGRGVGASQPRNAVGGAHHLLSIVAIRICRSKGRLMTMIIIIIIVIIIVITSS